MNKSKQALLEAIRRRMAQGSALARPKPLALAAVDDALKGGLARAALHEVAAADHRATPAAFGFLLALAASFASPAGTLVWVAEKKERWNFGVPYGPGLVTLGLDPGAFVFVRCERAKDALWAMEEALRVGGTDVCVGARPKAMDLTASRRLQLAAENAGAPILLFRAHDDGNQSVAVTRWRVAPLPGSRDRFGFLEHPRWRVSLERARGGKSGTWDMEWDRDALSLRLACGLGDRTARQTVAA